MSSRTEKIIFGVLFSVLLLLGGARFFMDGTHTSLGETGQEGETNSEKAKIAVDTPDGEKGTSSSVLVGAHGTENQEQSVDAVSSSIVKTVTVYVGGAVTKPGLYTLDADKRIQDAIMAAGNFTADGELGAINPAQRLRDEMNIVVPTKEEVSRAKAQGFDSSLQEVTLPNESNPKTADGSDNTAKININTASAEELQCLPAIGKAKAENILRYRQKKPFQTEEEIMNVSGIGKKVFEQIQPQICVK